MKSFQYLIVLSFVAMSGCTKFSAMKEIKKSLKANTSAKTLIDYELSGETPEDVFGRWREEKADAIKICEALSEITDQELTHFEEELNNSENESLIAPCKDALVVKLETYWKEQKAITPSVLPEVIDLSAGISFNESAVVRDTRGGYKVVSGDLANKQVVLTFDDGPHPQHTLSILKTLKSVSAKAIFFSMGNAARAYPDVLRLVGNQGHAVGSHSMSHKCLPFKKICASNNGRMLTFEEAKQEIIGGHRAVFQALGWVDPFFRFPYGESSAELSQFLRDRNVAEFFWSVDSNDWCSTKTPSSLVSGVMADVSARGRGVLLFHDIHRRTAEALPALLKELYYGGYQVVLMKPADAQSRNESLMLQ